jgi:hypothetical protein
MDPSDFKIKILQTTFILIATSGQYYPLALHTLFGSYAWPARSPALSPLDYYVLRHMKDMV